MYTIHSLYISRSDILQTIRFQEQGVLLTCANT